MQITKDTGLAGPSTARLERCEEHLGCTSRSSPRNSSWTSKMTWRQFFPHQPTPILTMIGRTDHLDLFTKLTGGRDVDLD